MLFVDKLFEIKITALIFASFFCLDKINRQKVRRSIFVENHDRMKIEVQKICKLASHVQIERADQVVIHAFISFRNYRDRASQKCLERNL